jgi:hypothetical protein
MTIPFNLEGALLRKEDLHAMIVQRRVCFDHGPFHVKDKMDNTTQVGLQRNFYTAFQGHHHLPIGEDSEHHEPMADLHSLCRLFLQSLDLLSAANTLIRPLITWCPRPSGGTEPRPFFRSRSSIMPTSWRNQIVTCRISWPPWNAC